MKLFSSLKILTTLSCSVALTTLALAQEGHDQAKAETPAAGSFIKADQANVSAEWLAQSTAAYPLDACMVSGDKLEGSDMGPPVNYVYRQAGQPDRLVRLCCNHCVRDFKKDPAKYLKMIDEAAAAKSQAGSAK